MLQLLMRQAAEEAFVHVDSCNKVRKALLSKSVPMRGPYRVGNLLSFHRKSKWYGPAQMLGNQGTSSIWLLHGGVTLLVPETHAVQHLQRRSTRRTSWSYDPVGNKDEKWWLRMGRKSIWTTMCPLQWTETRLDIPDHVLKDKHLWASWSLIFQFQKEQLRELTLEWLLTRDNFYNQPSWWCHVKFLYRNLRWTTSRSTGQRRLPSPSCHRHQFSATWAANRT